MSRFSYDEIGYSREQRLRDEAADTYTLIFAVVEEELIRAFHEEGGYGEYKPAFAKVQRLVEQRIAAMKD
jgi:hypothetical protein